MKLQMQIYLSDVKQLMININFKRGEEQIDILSYMYTENQCKIGKQFKYFWLLKIQIHIH